MKAPPRKRYLQPFEPTPDSAGTDEVEHGPGASHDDAKVVDSFSAILAPKIAFRDHDLWNREPAAWKEVGAFIQSKKPSDYDKAVALLKDLADLGITKGRTAAVDAKIQGIRDAYSARPALMRRLDQAGLGNYPLRVN